MHSNKDQCSKKQKLLKKKKKKKNSKIQKWAEDLKTFLQRRHTAGQHAREKILITAN